MAHARLLSIAQIDDFIAPLEKLDVSPPSPETLCDTLSAGFSLLGTLRLYQHVCSRREHRAHTEFEQQQDLSRSSAAHSFRSGQYACESNRAVSPVQLGRTARRPAQHGRR